MTKIRHAEIILTEMEHPDFRKTAEEYQQGQLRTLNVYLMDAIHDDKYKNDKSYQERCFRISQRRNKVRHELDI